ncbi:hypothetical protein AHF37_08482 [Paragonimus kellicotti]|nr:hypothetical protein AHF37_08482 [Paragonimus kellicotti]
MELVTELYASRGVDVPGPDHGHLPASGFTLDAVATFTVKALDHRLNEVLSIFRLATRFIKPTLVDFAERYGIPRVELHYALDKLVPVLFHRTGETSVRIREVAKAQILAMAEWPQTTRPNNNIHTTNPTRYHLT